MEAQREGPPMKSRSGSLSEVRKEWTSWWSEKKGWSPRAWRKLGGGGRGDSGERREGEGLTSPRQDKLVSSTLRTCSTEGHLATPGGGREVPGARALGAAEYHMTSHDYYYVMCRVT